jgi:hypothetical protein
VFLRLSISLRYSKIPLSFPSLGRSSEPSPYIQDIFTPSLLLILPTILRYPYWSPSLLQFHQSAPNFFTPPPPAHQTLIDVPGVGFPAILSHFPHRHHMYLRASLDITIHSSGYCSNSYLWFKTSLLYPSRITSSLQSFLDIPTPIYTTERIYTPITRLHHHLSHQERTARK